MKKISRELFYRRAVKHALKCSPLEDLEKEEKTWHLSKAFVKYILLNKKLICKKMVGNLVTDSNFDKTCVP